MHPPVLEGGSDAASPAPNLQAAQNARDGPRGSRSARAKSALCDATIAIARRHLDPAPGVHQLGVALADQVGAADGQTQRAS